MDEKELKELIALLDAAGVKYELCDTPVALSGNSAKCGLPTEIGDENIDDYILLPKALVGLHPEMFVPASGDSMIGAGYVDGDLLRVRFGAKAEDGDNVLALIDGACTVKTLFTDETGQKWLVPQNDKYDAILLKEDMDVQLLGRVVGVEKTTSRASSRDCLQSIRRTRNKMRTARKLTTDEVDECLVTMGQMVKHARQWYAVMRAMVDHEQAEAGEFQSFCLRVARLLPEHEHLPVAKELSRMAVQSFSRPVTMWDVNNAPVSGSRYYDYLTIALRMGELLSNVRK